MLCAVLLRRYRLLILLAPAALPEGFPFFRVSRKETTLIQEGIVNSALPPKASWFLRTEDKDLAAMKGEGWDEVDDTNLR